MAFRKHIHRARNNSPHQQSQARQRIEASNHDKEGEKGSEENNYHSFNVTTNKQSKLSSRTYQAAQTTAIG